MTNINSDVKHVSEDPDTYRRMVLITWFNDCILGKSGQIANQRSIPYHIIVYTHIYVCASIDCKCRKNSQFAVNRYL